jgi:L-2,4-diaminobutyrate decarboxylase
MRFDPYDPEFFRSAGHTTVDQLADYLHAALRREIPALPYRAPLELAREYQEPLPMAPAEDSLREVAARLQQVLGQSMHLHHPGYAGHQVPPPMPIGALASLASTLLNNSVAVYEMSQAGTQAERQVVRWLCGLLGWPAESDGVITSGGSLGNLTALLAARNHASHGDAWRQGLRAGAPLVLMVSDQAHYSVARAAGILGLGEDSVENIPVDSAYRADMGALAELYERLTQGGKKVMAIVGSAGTTATGSFDPLREMGEFCREQGVWFHVDGAHGASVLLSEKYRALAEGIELATSVVWDLHKMMFLPSLATAVLFRHLRDNYSAFSQEASYLFGRSQEEVDFDVALRTVECTKGTPGIAAWLALRVHGARAIGGMVTRQIDLASEFASWLKTQPDFDLAVPPQCNIVCFRHVPAEMKNEGACKEQLDAHQTRLRRKVVESGGYFLVQTRLRNGIYLRSALMNPRATMEDLQGLARAVREAAAG